MDPREINFLINMNQRALVPVLSFNDDDDERRSSVNLRRRFGLRVLRGCIEPVRLHDGISLTSFGFQNLIRDNFTFCFTVTER